MHNKLGLMLVLSLMGSTTNAGFDVIDPNTAASLSGVWVDSSKPQKAGLLVRHDGDSLTMTGQDPVSHWQYDCTLETELESCDSDACKQAVQQQALLLAHCEGGGRQFNGVDFSCQADLLLQADHSLQESWRCEYDDNEPNRGMLVLGGGDSTWVRPELPVAQIEDSAADSEVPAEAVAATDYKGPYDADADAKADIASALAIAAKENKLVLLKFGANWCLDCRVFSTLLDKPDIHERVTEHFVLVNIDVGSFDHNMDVSEAYGCPTRRGIPSALIIDHSNRLVMEDDGRIESARNFSEDDAVRWLDEIIKRSANGAVAGDSSFDCS